MTREQTKRLLARIRAAWPYFCRGKGRQELEAVVDTWHEMLQGQNEDALQAALHGLILTSRFAPSMAELLAAKQSIPPEKDLLLQASLQYSGLAEEMKRRAGEETLDGNRDE